MARYLIAGLVAGAILGIGNARTVSQDDLNGCKGVILVDSYDGDIDAHTVDQCEIYYDTYSYVLECIDSDTAKYAVYNDSAACDGTVYYQETFNSISNENGTVIVNCGSDAHDCTVMQRYQWWDSTFTCNDGCEIRYGYVNDSYCDCAACEDEYNVWNCTTCANGCPTSCGDYDHECWDYNRRTLVDSYGKHNQPNNQLQLQHLQFQLKNAKWGTHPKFGGHSRRLVSSNAINIVQDCSGSDYHISERASILDFCSLNNDSDSGAYSFMFTCDDSQEVVWKNWTSDDCSGDAHTTLTKEFWETCKINSDDMDTSQTFVDNACGDTDQAPINMPSFITLFVFGIIIAFVAA